MTIDSLSKFINRVSYRHALITLYLANKFNGIFMGDLVTILDVLPNRISFVTRNLTDVGAITKHHINTQHGRLARIETNPETFPLISDMIATLEHDDEIKGYCDKYKVMVEKGDSQSQSF